MPSTNIHEYVAFQLAKKYNHDSVDFFLGNMAPDAVNINGFAEKEKRWEAHQRCKDLNEWIEDAKKFYYQNLKNYPKEFILGYLTHIITDIAHDKYLYEKQIEIIEKETRKYGTDAHNILRDDMEKFTFKEWESIIEVLDTNESYYDILNISKDMMKEWYQKRKKQFKGKNKSKYQIKEDLEKLVEIVAEIEHNEIQESII